MEAAVDVLISDAVETVESNPCAMPTLLLLAVVKGAYSVAGASQGTDSVVVAAIDDKFALLAPAEPATVVMNG